MESLSNNQLTDQTGLTCYLRTRISAHCVHASSNREDQFDLISDLVFIGIVTPHCIAVMVTVWLQIVAAAVFPNIRAKLEMSLKNY